MLLAVTARQPPPFVGGIGTRRGLAHQPVACLLSGPASSVFSLPPAPVGARQLLSSSLPRVGQSAGRLRVFDDGAESASTAVVAESAPSGKGRGDGHAESSSGVSGRHGKSKNGAAAAPGEPSDGGAVANVHEPRGANGAHAAHAAHAAPSGDKSKGSPQSAAAAAGAAAGRDKGSAEREKADQALTAKRDRAGASSVSSGCRLEGVSKTFKNTGEVLKHVSWECKKGERVGLVGNNGAGKTTQLEIIMGTVAPDKGDVLLAPRARVAKLAQEFDVVPDRTVREELMSVFQKELDLVHELAETETAIEGATTDLDAMGDLLDKLAELQARAAGPTLDLYSMDKKVDRIMAELGLTADDNERLVAAFSGGWQMRICLGKILLQEPDILLLDEPTNHLDLDALEWLEAHLKTLDIPMVIVSHDREFLDQLCTKIVETARGVAVTYPGNYSDFVRQKAAAEAAQRAAYERQQKEIDRLADMAQRLEGGAQASRAEAASREAERLQAEGTRVDKPWEEAKHTFRFPDQEQSGRVVLTIDGLEHGYDGGQAALFQGAHLTVERGDRVAIVGPNGCGKSTLLRLIRGTEKPQAGTVTLGSHNVVANYFEQNQAEALDLDAAVLETLERAAVGWKEADIKALLGRFLFRKDSIHKKVGWLSGGEKARLAMAKFMVSPATLLVLDEPTNHLDIASKEMLEDALRNYQGTVIAVSHDRYFLKQMATRIVEVRDGQLEAYAGDYAYYLAKLVEEDVTVAAREGERADKAKDIAQSQIKAKSKMSKAEKMEEKKQKAKAFNAAAAGSAAAKKGPNKNDKRWS